MNSLFRNLSPRTLFVFGLVLPLLCTVVIAWLQWDVVSDMVANRVIGRQIRQVQLDLGMFRYSLSDAESCQFRYILSHDPTDLDLYSKLMAETASHFAELRSLTSGNDVQQKYLDQIESLLKAKEDAANKSFDLEKQGDHAGAMQIISSDAGRQNILDIEKLVEQMQNVESQWLALRQLVSSHNLKVTAALSVASVGLCLACIAGILLMMRRLQHVQATVTFDALAEMISYEDGTMTIEDYLRRRAERLATHGQAQIEAEKMLSQLERRKARSATKRVKQP